MHISLNVSETRNYEFALNGIGKFRNYYEQLIAMSDPDYYYTCKPDYFLAFEDPILENRPNPNINSASEVIVKTTLDSEKVKKGHKLSIAKIIFSIYLIGALFFLSKILLSFYWIYKTIKLSPKEKWQKVTVVQLDKNLPPFSFLSYVFLKKEWYLEDKYDHILAHEKEHISQLHSFDLLLAHFITIIQWFNPFVWLLHKAIKTNHEYLADKSVVKKGFNLLDYQELLLKQFLSIPSVQLVNNFNLISIKNRIQMMNKIKSGFAAKLKALLIIPAAIFTFILFANLTLNGPGKVLTNLSFFEIQNNMNQLKGLWKNTSDNTYGFQVLFDTHKFSVMNHNTLLKEYPYQLKENQIILGTPRDETIELKYEIVNDQLKIWWNQTEYSLYKKSKFTNSLDDYLSTIDESINLPVIENYWLIQRLDLCIDVAMVNDKIYVNKTLIDYSKLKDVLLKEKSRINHLDANLITIRIYADKDLRMEYMYKLNQVLREIGILKIAHMGNVNDDKVSKLHRAYIGMPKKLPPMEGIEIVPELELAERGITYFEMDATNPENTPDILKPKFEETIKKSDKYVASLLYDKNTIFNKYLGYQDMARTVIFEFRNKYAMEKYNLAFEDLSSIQQKEIRKIYPLIISEAESFIE